MIDTLYSIVASRVTNKLLVFVLHASAVRSSNNISHTTLGLAPLATTTVSWGMGEAVGAAARNLDKCVDDTSAELTRTGRVYLCNMTVGYVSA